jgi:hypothetical protein
LNADLDAITAIDAAIVKAGGHVTPQQQEQLEDEFADANVTVAKSLTLMDQALQVMSAFCAAQQGRSGIPANLGADNHSAMKTDATKTENDLIGEIACGAGDVQSGFNGMFATLDSAFAGLNVSFNALSDGFGAAVDAIEALTGEFVALQAEFGVVTDALAEAQSLPPGAPLRRLKLGIARSDWADLAAQALFEFS